MRSALPPLLLVFAASAPAFEVSWNDWTIHIMSRLQLRLDVGTAQDTDGSSWNPWNDNGTADRDLAWNLSLRRARLFFFGLRDDGYFWNFSIKSDNIGRFSSDADVAVHASFIGRHIQQGALRHSLKGGYDWHTASRIYLDSAYDMLMPTGRYASNFGVASTIGLDYLLTAPAWSLRLGVADRPQGEDGDLMFYTRLATSFSEDLRLARYRESYAGAPGIGHELGIGLDQHVDGSAPGDGGTMDDDFSVAYLDYMLHYERISLTADIAYGMAGSGCRHAGLLPDDDGWIGGVQLGYAIPLADGRVLEPTMRAQRVNATSSDTRGRYVFEGGADGSYASIGLNYYLEGHRNKLQTQLQWYQPEAGDGDATILHMQYQLDF